MQKRDQPYLYREIIGFYLPLLLNQGVVTLTAPFLNFGVSRALSPATALAAFGASFSVTIVFNSLIMASLRVYNSLLKDEKSFFAILKFFMTLAVCAGCIFALFAGTTAGDVLFTSLFNLSDQALVYAKAWMWWMIPVPALIALRCALQGVSTVYRKTIYSALGTGLRMCAAFGVVSLLIFLFPDRPGTASGAAFCLATVAEILLLGFLTRRLRRFSDETAVEGFDFSLTPAYLFRYSIPLWMSSLAWTGSFPLINHFIAQTLIPESGLAGFSILRALNVCLNSPLVALATAVLILGNRRTMKRLLILGGALGAGLTLISGILYLPRVSHILLAGVFNLTGESLSSAAGALFYFLFFPVLFYIRFFTEGLFMREKRPAAIGVTGLIRLVLIWICGAALVRFYPELPGAILGMVLLTAASLSDAGFTFFAFYVGHRKVLG